MFRIVSCQRIQKSTKKRSRVLLVEDNAGDALLVGQALADCPTPVRLHIARDGEQALQMIHSI
jgi:CheY-like chemotaxis protein